MNWLQTVMQAIFQFLLEESIQECKYVAGLKPCFFALFFNFKKG